MSDDIRFKVVVPARYASTRLPAKPLLDLGGKPMVVRVAERAALSGAEEIWVATDHQDVEAAATAHGLSVLLTRADHPTGTDRLAEVVERLGWGDDTIVVNVQGDEPLIDPALVAETARQLAKSGADIATVAHPIDSAADFFNPNIVKVVCKADGDALYFSRATIPYARDHFAKENGGGFGSMINEALFGRTGPRGGQYDGLVQTMTKTAARSVASGLGRQLVRGILGGLMGGKR